MFKTLLVASLMTRSPVMVAIMSSKGLRAMTRFLAWAETMFYMAVPAMIH
jgi:hypothetical protein